MFQPGSNDALSRNFMKLWLLVALENANRQTHFFTNSFTILYLPFFKFGNPFCWYKPYNIYHGQCLLNHPQVRFPQKWSCKVGGLPVQDRMWAGPRLFESVNNQKRKGWIMKKDLPLWNYPPEPEYSKKTGVPQGWKPFFRHRIFRWMPVTDWGYKILCYGTNKKKHGTYELLRITSVASKFKQLDMLLSSHVIE